MAKWKIQGPLPFDDAMGKLQTLNKAIGKLGGAKWSDEENGILGPLMTQWNINLRALKWRNGQITDPSDDKIGPPMTW